MSQDSFLKDFGKKIWSTGTGLYSYANTLQRLKKKHLTHINSKFSKIFSEENCVFDGFNSF